MFEQRNELYARKNWESTLYMLEHHDRDVGDDLTRRTPDIDFRVVLRVGGGGFHIKTPIP